LCDLEGKTIKEAAQQLGWPQETLAGRLARGRKLLANRGVVLSAGSLAVVVSQNVASAGVPTSLMGSTVKAACMIATGQTTVTGLVPAKVAVLTEGVLKSMFLTKLKSVMAVTVALAVTVGIGAGSLGYGTAARQRSEGKKTDAVAPPKEAAKSDKDQLQVAATVNGEAILAEEVSAAAYLSLPDAHNLTALDRSRRITAVC